MVAIHTSEDIIRALREDPDLLDQVRRAVMTDEVLALPGQFAAMLETQNRMLGDIADMRQTQNAMLETQNRMLGDIASLRETQNRILDEQAGLRETQNQLLETQNVILRRLGNLETRFGRLDHDYRNFRGNYAENAARKRAPSIAMHLDESKNLEIDELTIAVLSSPEILALVGEYGSDRLASIPRETRRSFYEADLIIRADKTDGSTFYIAVEASYTCDERDTTRAMSHSRLITEFTGREAWPAIAGVRLNRNIKPIINSGEVFWFAIEEDDLEP